MPAVETSRKRVRPASLTTVIKASLRAVRDRDTSTLTTTLRSDAASGQEPSVAACDHEAVALHGAAESCRATNSIRDYRCGPFS